MNPIRAVADLAACAAGLAIAAACAVVAWCLIAPERRRPPEDRD